MLNGDQHKRKRENTIEDHEHPSKIAKFDEGEVERRETLREVWEQVSSSLNRLEHFVQDKDKQKRPWNTHEYASMYTYVVALYPASSCSHELITGESTMCVHFLSAHSLKLNSTTSIHSI